MSSVTGVEWRTSVGDDGVVRSASFSTCGLYRYSLIRSWATWPPKASREIRLLPWVMLNPSTADEHVDDQTVKQVMFFSKREGFTGCLVVNLFALRTAYPELLGRHLDPVGPHNAEVLERTLTKREMVVAAWGGHRAARAPGERLRRAHPGMFRCLGRTAAGAPRHPARLAHRVRLEAF